MAARPGRPVASDDVRTAATLVNMRDEWEVRQKLRQSRDVRSVEVADALADTGTTMLALPTQLVQQLGLTQTSTKRVTSATGSGEAAIYGTVRLTIQGREFVTDVMEVPDGVPVLIGQLPLEYLDFVVDPLTQRLVGNPAHGGDTCWSGISNTRKWSAQRTLRRVRCADQG